MGISRTYRLPWQDLDPNRIEAAAATVAASLPNLTSSIERQHATTVRVYFSFTLSPTDVPHDWRASPLFEEWNDPNRPAALPVQIEVRFDHLPADASSANNLFLMSVDGSCWNQPLWPLATDLMDRLCRHWKVEPEWW
jgi:hypothetical protein